MPAIVGGDVRVNVSDVPAQVFDTSHPTVTQGAVKGVTRVDVIFQALLACKHFGTVVTEEGKRDRSIRVNGVPMHPFLVF